MFDVENLKVQIPASCQSIFATQTKRIINNLS